MGVETKRQSINMSNDNNVESLQDIHGFKLLNKTKNNNKWLRHIVFTHDICHLTYGAHGLSLLKLGVFFINL